MRVLIQRVQWASVRVEGRVVGEITCGLLIFVGVEAVDSIADVEWLAEKICKLRIFADADGKMNESLLQGERNLLVVSQFTLHAATQKGNRPSFIRAAPPDQARQLYLELIRELQQRSARTVATGQFGADMQVELLNDGPVTIWMDSQARE